MLNKYKEKNILLTLLFLLCLCHSCISNASDDKSLEFIHGCPRIIYEGETLEQFISRREAESGSGYTSANRAYTYQSEVDKFEVNIKEKRIRYFNNRPLSNAEIKSCKKLVVRIKDQIRELGGVQTTDSSCSNMYVGKPVRYELSGCAFFCERRAIVIGVGRGVASVKAEDGQIREKSCSDLY
jgi:hypothetical protein